MALYRKPSRTVNALKIFEGNCRKHGFLPEAQEIPKTQLTLVIERFRDAIDAYFDKDILFSNRTYRYHTKILMRRLRTVDEHLRRKEVSFIAAQDMMAEFIEESIQDIAIAERPNAVFKLFSYVAGKPTCTLTQSLMDTKLQLQEADKKLLPSYKLVIFPHIRKAFQSALNSYLEEGKPTAKAPEPKRASSPLGKMADVAGEAIAAAKNVVIDGLTDLADALGFEATTVFENRVDGFRQGRELMLSLSNEVCNGQHAAFILENGIKSLREAYPILAMKIAHAMQGLQETGILPKLTVEEFGSYLRDKVKKDAEVVANMKAGIEKLERMERSSKYSKDVGAEERPPGPHHHRAAATMD